jgi:hypothetical protein
MTGHDELAVAAREDMAQQAVLSMLLDAHPGHLSIEEVVSGMTDRPEEFSARDAINNAIRDLVGAGLLHRHGTFVFATRAAVRFEQLQI